MKYIILRSSVEQTEWEAQTEEQRLEALTTGSGPYFKGHKFRVAPTGYRPGHDKKGSFDYTPDGKLDMMVGPIVWMAEYAVHTTETLSSGDSTDLYGSKGDLAAYYLFNTPQPTTGSPSNLITLTDHYQVEHDGFLVGKHFPEPLSTILLGTEAHYIIPITFVEKQAVG